ncbi:hypothetical protein [Leifsonia sp. 563]|uniref:hypothetical protein n=1 Tax=Leifsonia sp. 563 TaxID=3156412 RepID=UPI00339141CA
MKVRMVKKRSIRVVVPVTIGMLLVGVDVVGVFYKASVAGVDATTVLLALPSCFAVVAGGCLAGVSLIGRSRAARTEALTRMFPEAVIENVNDQPGNQLYRFRSLVSDPNLVSRRRLGRPSVSIVVVSDSIQGWVGSVRPRRAFLLPKTSITSISLSEHQATPIAAKPSMKVGLNVGGTIGELHFVFGGGKSRNSWSLMNEAQTGEVVRKVQTKLGCPR